MAAKTYHTEGVRQFKAKQFKEAISSFKRAVKFSPDFAAAWLDLANAQLSARNLEKAETAFTKAVELNPSVAVAHYNLAYVLRKLGKHDRAVLSYQKYVAIKPNDADAFYGMAESLKASGNNVKAASAYRRYAELEKRPGRKEWQQKAIAQADALMEQITKSTSTPAPAAPVVKTTPAPAKAAPMTTKKAEPVTKPTAAKPATKETPKTDVFAKMLNRQKPEPPKETRPAEFNLAVKALQDKQYEAAMMQLKVALGKSPNDPLILAALGSTHLGREDPMAAIESYQRALQSAPNNARASIELGLAEAFRLNEDDDEAEALYRKLIDNPKVSAQIRDIAAKNISFVD